MKTLPEHLEEYLGPIRDGFSPPVDEEHAPFQIVEFADGQLEGVHAYSTLGLSQKALRSPRSQKLIHHELLFLCRPFSESKYIAALLHQAGEEAITRDTAYLRGEVLGPRGPLFTGSNLEALYVAMPVYLPDAFAAHTEPDGRTVVIAWLVPITRNEAEFVRTFGWGKFEDLLVEKDPDLLDMGRPSLV